MAVYTALGAADLAALLGAFDAGPAESWSPIAAGIENTNYRVSAGAGEFVLTLYERAAAAQVEAVLGTTARLAARGVPCPRARPARDGGFTANYRGRPVSLVVFAAGECVSAPSVAHLETLGGTLAELHRAGAELALPGREHTPAVLLPAGLRAAERLAAGQPALADLIRTECRWQAACLPDPPLPAGLIHADLFRDNVLFVPGGSRVTALLDFHLGGQGPWLFDLAVVLLDWCWGAHGLDGDRARAVLRGYRDRRPPEGSEVRHLPVLLRRAALRYLVLRCERFLLSDQQRLLGVRKEPGELAAKLAWLRASGEGDNPCAPTP